MTPLKQLSFAAQREAQQLWARNPISHRLRLVRKLRHQLADRANLLASTVSRDPAQTLTAEVLPLLEACSFLEQNAEGVLKPRRVSTPAPQWLRGVKLTIHREPFGVVLVIGPSNYPLFLPAVHALQALVAGNAVILKPGRGGLPAATAFSQAVSDAGFDTGLISLLSEDVEDVKEAIDIGVDKVVLTGSSATGRAVLGQLAMTGTPSVMELSGHDVVFVRPGANLELVRRAVRFGLTFNGGETCIAPKLIIAWSRIAFDFGVPVEVASSDEEALAIAARSGYALGATIFGHTDDCVEFAQKVRAGVIVVNDMIVPTADPRLPFGGRDKSGFGVTRGAEGLLEMTSVKSIAVRRGRWLPHLGATHPIDAELFTAYIGWLHGGALKTRVRALGGLIRAARERRHTTA